MTPSRRFRRTYAAACGLASGLFAGCAGTSEFTAGRLPYGNAAMASAARQDPFLAQSGPSTAAGPSPSGTSPPAVAAQPGSNPHQAAYREPRRENPFVQVSASATEQAEQAEWSEQAEWADFETPAVAEEPNPFAEIEGMPAVTPPSVTRTSAAEPLPRITPGNGTSDRWESHADATAQYPAEEFLPPAQ